MPAGPIVQVEGARELRRTLKKAGADLNDLGAVHATVAKYVALRAAAYAPKRSGTLAGDVRGNKAKTSAIVRVGGSKVPYAGPIHWGWPARHIRANPFATTAAEVTEPVWTKWYLARVQQVVDSVRGV
jgi:hypothetical protein